MFLAAPARHARAVNAAAQCIPLSAAALLPSMSWHAHDRCVWSQKPAHPARPLMDRAARVRSNGASTVRQRCAEGSEKGPWLCYPMAPGLIAAQAGIARRTATTRDSPHRCTVTAQKYLAERALPCQKRTQAPQAPYMLPRRKTHHIVCAARLQPVDRRAFGRHRGALKASQGRRAIARAT